MPTCAAPRGIPRDIVRGEAVKETATRVAAGTDGPAGGDATSVPDTTRQVTRGAARLFEDLGCAVVTEFALANGRRAVTVRIARVAAQRLRALTDPRT